MIWVNGKQYEDKEDAFQQGAITDEQRIILTTCGCCGENELEKLKSMQYMYEEEATKRFDAQQEAHRLKPGAMSAGSRVTWQEHHAILQFELAQAKAHILQWAIGELEGRGGCW